MIIRAVSSDEEDDTSDALRLGRHDVSSPNSLSSSSAVKLAWVGASLALVALMLLDLPALLNLLAPSVDARPPQRADPFSVLSWLLILGNSSATATPPATLLNNLIGQLFVCAWIYCRESALAAQRHRLAGRSRGGSMELPKCITQSFPWPALLGVVALGHIASCLYVLFALFESHGGNERLKFWLGKSSVGSRTAPRV